jgi:hypothetical protein
MTRGWPAAALEWRRAIYTEKGRFAMSQRIIIDEVHSRQASHYWIAINQASCAMSAIPMPGVPKVTPTPQGLIGFPTLAAAKAAQQLCLTAPIPDVAEAIEGWRAGKDGAVVVDCDNPEPPQDVTLWSVPEKNRR